MAGKNTETMEFITGEVKKFEGIMVPVKAGFLERLFVRKVSAKKLHPNPDDEFSWPSIGPNMQIISNYADKFRRFGNMQPEFGDEPLMVEKVSPDGYMILNGHHRWIAGMRAGISKMPVSIVNLTQETDVKKMILESKHDKRVTLDLNELVFCKNPDDPCEKPPGFPINKLYKERIQPGIPALLHYLSKEGYDIWVYTYKLYSVEYIRAYFHKYSVKVDGIVTGAFHNNRARKESKKRLDALFAEHYKETFHIDRDSVLQTFTNSREFNDYPVDTTDTVWSQAVINVFKGLKNPE